MWDEQRTENKFQLNLHYLDGEPTLMLTGQGYKAQQKLSNGKIGAAYLLLHLLTYNTYK